MKMTILIETRNKYNNNNNNTVFLDEMLNLPYKLNIGKLVINRN